MNILTIDIGSKNLKVLLFRKERRKINYIQKFKIELKGAHQFEGEEKKEKYKKFTSEQLSNPFFEAFEKINIYLKDQHEVDKIIVICPQSYLTDRFINLPVKDQKKAEQMIPFQLDENLPFSTSSVHYDILLLPTINKQYHAAISIIPKNIFEDCHKISKNFNLPINGMTTPISSIQFYLNSINFKGSTCILDIGNKMTKCYFILNGIVVSSHLSYIGSESFIENISHTYGITPEEANDFFKKNSFFKTKNMTQELDEDQEGFAELMKNVAKNIISDFKKWELGYTVNFNQRLDSIYLTGSVSNIQNINKFLEEELSKKVFKIEELVDTNTIDQSFWGDDLSSYFVSYCTSFYELSKDRPINLFSKEFSMSNSINLPLHQLTFSYSRYLVILFCIFSFLLVDRIITNIEFNKINKKVSRILKKNNAIKLTQREKISFKRSPKKVKRKISEANSNINFKIKTINELSKVNVFNNLNRVSDILARTPEVDVLSFEGSNNYFSLQMSSENKSSLMKVLKQIKSNTVFKCQDKIELNSSSINCKESNGRK